MQASAQVDRLAGEYGKVESQLIDKSVDPTPADLEKLLFYGQQLRHSGMLYVAQSEKPAVLMHCWVLNEHLVMALPADKFVPTIVHLAERDAMPTDHAELPFTWKMEEAGEALYLSASTSEEFDQWIEVLTSTSQ